MVHVFSEYFTGMITSLSVIEHKTTCVVVNPYFLTCSLGYRCRVSHAAHAFLRVSQRPNTIHPVRAQGIANQCSCQLQSAERPAATLSNCFIHRTPFPLSISTSQYHSSRIFLPPLITALLSGVRLMVQTGTLSPELMLARANESVLCAK